MNRLLSTFLLCALAVAAARLMAQAPVDDSAEGGSVFKELPLLPADWIRYTIGEPTAEEQMYLELINRARRDPFAEALRLANTSDQDIIRAYDFFGTDLQKFANETAVLPPAPPLSFEARLLGAARSHSLFMLTNAVQFHEQTNYQTGAFISSSTNRIAATGYPIAAIGESIYINALNPDHGHAAFEVDWGAGPSGLQEPPEHRLTNHDPDLREIGVGVINGNGTRRFPAVFTTNIFERLVTNTVVVTNNNQVLTNRFVTNQVLTNIITTPAFTNVSGPQVVTLKFGTRIGAVPLITGVAYYDINTNGFYDLNEGVPGIRVEAPGTKSWAITTRSGGFSVEGLGGANMVRFAADGIAPVTQNATVPGTENVKLDLVLPVPNPPVQGPNPAALDRPNFYTTTPVFGATAYDWWTARQELLIAPETASGASSVLTFSVSGYNPIVPFGSGNAFRLTHFSPVEPQIIAYQTPLRLGTNAGIEFDQLFLLSTVHQVAYLELSTDGGSTWTNLWSRRGVGTNGTPDSSFRREQISFAPYTGRDVNVRFRYSAEGPYFSELRAQFGFFLDNIRVTNTEILRSVANARLPAGQAFPFTPSQAGTWRIRVRPVTANGPLIYGPETALATAATTNPSGRLRLTSIRPLGSDQVLIDFAQLTGVGGAYRLERAPQAGGPWDSVASAILGTNGPGQYFFRATPVTNTSLFRVTAR
jgi:hypothetical protein